MANQQGLTTDDVLGPLRMLACKLHSERMAFPYRPMEWLARAQLHQALGYPELVAGDCWKASQLCQSLLTAIGGSSGLRLGYGAGFWMHDPTYDPGEIADDDEALRTRLHTIARDAQELQQRCMKFDSTVSGRYLLRDYPWMRKKHRIRDNETLSKINRAMDHAPGRLGGESRCTVVRNALDIEGAHDTLGVVATIDLTAESAIIIDRSDAWGCVVSKGLADSVEQGQRSTLEWLGMDREEAVAIFNLLRTEDCSDSARTLLKVRCLRRIVLDGDKHPLDHLIMAGIKATYHRQQMAEFNLVDDIIVPNRALSMLGIDIFANQNFDTWVLFTMEARIDNNCFVTSTSAGLASLFAMFNHSCEPNVRWNSSKSHCSLELHAIRDIRAGEQLFVSYNEYAMEKPVRKRQADLSRWIDGPCKCDRCLREMQTSDEELPIPAQIPAWNSFAKAVFPEDLQASLG